MQAEVLHSVASKLARKRPLRLSWRAEYAQVLRMLGNGRLEAMCIDGVKRLCHIRGKMRKKVWVNTVSGPKTSLGRLECMGAQGIGAAALK